MAQASSSGADINTHAMSSILSLPPELLSSCMLALSLKDLGCAATVCSDLRAVCNDPALWCALLRNVWLKPHGQPYYCEEELPEGATARAEFIERLGRYRMIDRLRFGIEDGPWLREVRTSGGGQGLVLVEPFERRFIKQQLDLTYWGTTQSAHDDHAVGCAVARMRSLATGSESPATGSGLAWPVGGGTICVRYYEATVVDAGECGFIAIGWSRDGYAQKCRQPGWGAHTYGYHGDDGRAYHHSGYGKRFHGPFSTGSIVGTGLVFWREAAEVADDSDIAVARGVIFFTIDGVLVGAPFESALKVCASPAISRLLPPSPAFSRLLSPSTLLT